MSLCWESVLSKMLLYTEPDRSVQVLNHVSAKKQAVLLSETEHRAQRFNRE